MLLGRKILVVICSSFFLLFAALSSYLYMSVAASTVSKEGQFLNYRLNSFFLTEIKGRYELLVNTDLVADSTVVDAFKEEIKQQLGLSEKMWVILEGGASLGQGFISADKQKAVFDIFNEGGIPSGTPHDIELDAGVFSAIYFDRWDWLVVIGKPRAEIAATIRESFVAGFGVFLSVGLVVMFLIMLFMRKSILEPIAKLVEFIEAVARYDFDHTIQLNRKDEFGVLCEKMEFMSTKLRRHLEERESWGKELEGKIEERTNLLSLANSNLKEAMSANHRFMARVSHDLRTPLNAIIGYSDLILELDDTDEIELADVTRIRDSGAFLLNMVDDILTYNTLEANAFKINKKLVPGGEFFADFKKSIQHLVEQNHNTFSIEGLDALDSLVTDPHRLRQVLNNIVGNACKFTNNGEIGIKVSLNEQNLIIAISDTGIGIDNESLDAIFEVFEQAHDMSQHDVHGTGLGLSISKKIVALLGGHITVSSVVGEGTVFMITLENAHVSRPLSA